MHSYQPITQLRWLSLTFTLSLCLVIVIWWFTQTTVLTSWKPELQQVRPRTQSIQDNAPQSSLSQGQHVLSDEIPKGLSGTDWDNIQQQINAGKYRAYPNSEGGYRSSNPAHGWKIRYEKDGTTRLSPQYTEEKAYQIDMKLTAIGYDKLQILDQPQQISADGSTVTYHWNNNLKEWWINTPDQLEQWFSLSQRPVDMYDTQTESAQPLILQLNVDSAQIISQYDNALSFTQPNGNTITYSKLKAWDATGRSLPVRMHLINQQIKLIIDDSMARYPLTIDPNFRHESYLEASNAESGDNFGIVVATARNTVVIGAPGEDSIATGINGDQSNNAAINSGAAYVFVRNGTSWSQQAYLKASNTGGGFGSSVAISGDTIVIGANRESSNAIGINGDQSNNAAINSGAAYVFIRNGTTWSQQAYLKASNTDGHALPIIHGDSFGESVAIDDDTVVIGAPAEDSNATGVNGDQNNNSERYSGAAYVFTRSGSSWSQQAYLKASNTGASDNFGTSVAIAGDTVVVGARGERSNVNGDQSNNAAEAAGAAYVFTRDGTNWSQQAYLKASNAGEVSAEFRGDFFGGSVDIADDTVVVGAIGEDSNATGINGDQNNNAATDSGAVYIFTRSGSSWSQQAYVKASNTKKDDEFGTSVAITGDTVVVGAPGEDSKPPFSSLRFGAVYVFTRSGTRWSQKSYLKVSRGGGSLGSSVDISSGTIIVGSGYRGNSTHVFRLPTLTVGGLVTGLLGSNSVVLINAGDKLTLNANRKFTFPTVLSDGSGYNVIVLTQPTTPNQTCSVANGAGILTGVDVTNVIVTCSTNTHTINGNVSGLSVGNSIILQNNAGDNLTLNANGNFSFPTALFDGSAYAITVLTQPTSLNQTCSVGNASGTLAGANISDVAVTCIEHEEPILDFAEPTAGVKIAKASINAGGGPACGFDMSETGFVETNNISTSAPTSYQFVHGLLRFKLIHCLPDSSVEVKVTWPTQLPVDTQFWKYGPPSAGASNIWFQPASVRFDFTNNTTTYIVVNNGTGDLDNDPNTIVDPIGVAIPPTPIPTLSEWATILLMFMLGLVVLAQSYWWARRI